jgi:quercetin dioxygenase-like cupin family protein
MHEFSTLRAETVTRDPAPHEICLFEAALWGAPAGRALHEMRPAFTAGGFPMPQIRRNTMLIVDAGMALPPSGGYVEEIGRNRYIDGCSASLLVMPPRKGDPCVNHLHIAAGTAQTGHRHPSERIGMVVRGRGLAHHEAGPPMVLYPGRAWRVLAGERHRFETGGEALDILVFQPDSEWAPTDEAHRMPDATIV